MRTEIEVQEGDTCLVCKVGTMEYQEVEGCSCHISPPCNACTSVELECSECDDTTVDSHQLIEAT